MHRVELKFFPVLEYALGWAVPNAPCGVEIHECYDGLRAEGKFLMHRVELKLVNLFSIFRNLF